MKIKSTALFVLIAGIILFFQSCESPVGFFGSPDPHESASGASGNGDVYTGKPVHYLQAESGNPCGRVSLQGTPFPEKQIQILGGVVSLVRENCADLALPRPLASNEFQFDSVANVITYQGLRFNPYGDLSEFNLIPMVCPPGRTPLAAAGPNQFADPLNLAAASWWKQPIVSTNLFGSIEAIPRFRVSYNANGAAGYESVLQTFTLNPSTPNSNDMYHVSFLLQQGNTPSAQVTVGANNNQMIITTLDFSAGTYVVSWTNGPVTVNQTSIRPYGAGYVVDLFFTNLNSVPWNTAIGVHPEVAPGANTAGAFVYATAGDFRRVDSYCAP